MLHKSLELNSFVNEPTDLFGAHSGCVCAAAAARQPCMGHSTVGRCLALRVPRTSAPRSSRPRPHMCPWLSRHEQAWLRNTLPGMQSPLLPAGAGTRPRDTAWVWGSTGTLAGHAGLGCAKLCASPNRQTGEEFGPRGRAHCWVMGCPTLGCRVGCGSSWGSISSFPRGCAACPALAPVPGRGQREKEKRLLPQEMLQPRGTGVCRGSRARLVPCHRGDGGSSGVTFSGDQGQLSPPTVVSPIMATFGMAAEDSRLLPCCSDRRRVGHPKPPTPGGPTTHDGPLAPPAHGCLRAGAACTTRGHVPKAGCSLGVGRAGDGLCCGSSARRITPWTPQTPHPGRVRMASAGHNDGCPHHWMSVLPAQPMLPVGTAQHPWVMRKLLLAHPPGSISQRGLGPAGETGVLPLSKGIGGNTVRGGGLSRSHGAGAVGRFVPV